LKQGAKNLTKAAAIGALAIGVFDLVDGLDGGAGSTDVQVGHDVDPGV
jgi:hypothetical protein